MTTQPAMTAELLSAEIERIDRLVYVPGQWRCPRCNFTLQQMNLNAHDGTVAANDKPGEKCPNCDSALWRCTWKSDAIEMGKRGEELLLRAAKAERERDELTARLSGMAAAPSPPDGWMPIESCPCDDTVALGYDEAQGRMFVIGFDHDSDPAYWRSNGVTHWRELPPAPKSKG